MRNNANYGNRARYACGALVTSSLQVVGELLDHLYQDVTNKQLVWSSTRYWGRVCTVLQLPA